MVLKYRYQEYNLPMKQLTVKKCQKKIDWKDTNSICKMQRCKFCLDFLWSAAFCCRYKFFTFTIPTNSKHIATFISFISNANNLILKKKKTCVSLFLKVGNTQGSLYYLFDQKAWLLYTTIMEKGLKGFQFRQTLFTSISKKIKNTHKK